MSLRLEYQDQFGKLRRYALRPFEVGTVGSGANDNHFISFDRELHPGHFSLRYVGNQWIVEASTNCSLQISGRTLRHAILAQGDEFKAGQTIFKVEIAEGAPHIPRHSEQAPGHSPKPLVERAFEFQERVFGKFLEVRVLNANSRCQELLSALGSNSQVGLLVNRKAAITPDLQLEGWQTLTMDLFTLAPEEIRAENSLEFGHWDARVCSDRAIENLARSGAVIALFYRGHEKELLDAKKLYWAWFARPSILWFHLQNVSPTLMENLMHGLESIALWGPTGQDLICFGAPENLADLTKLLKPKD